MAHSYSQTLLARCGFNDVDRGNARHTLACLYVGHRMRLKDQEESRERGILLRVERDRATYEEWGVWACPLVKSGQAQPSPEAQYEVPVKTRSRFVIGFVDVVHMGFLTHRAAEIKITPQSADDILRQVQLYQDADDGVRAAEWWIVCDFDTSLLQTLAAGNPRIKVLRLGPAFEEWCAEQADAAPATANLL